MPQRTLLGLAQHGRVSAPLPDPGQQSHSAFQRAVECTAPVRGQRADDQYPPALGLQGDLATLVAATARAVDIGQVNIGAANALRQAAHHEPYPLLGAAAYVVFEPGLAIDLDLHLTPPLRRIDGAQLRLANNP